MHRLIPRLFRLSAIVVAAAALAASGCAAQPNYYWSDSAAAAGSVPETPGALGTAPEQLAFADDPTDHEGASADAADDAAAGSAEDTSAETSRPAPSTEFCTASANIWTHSAALNMLGTQATPEMTRVAVANVAQWLERASLYDDELATERADMFAAFTELTATLDADWANDWQAFQQSSAYAADPAAQSFDAARAELVEFVGAHCDEVRLVDMRADAEARTKELLRDFAPPEGTVSESDSLPGHAIFTHGTGRLVASFPAAWDHDQDVAIAESGALAQFMASPDIEAFMAGEAVDGVHLQLFEATDIDAFRALIDATATASNCERTADLSDAGAVRLNVTQTYVCDDHGASVIGQYSPSRGLGLIIEASFDRLDASRADLTRLASIANSALWR